MEVRLGVRKSGFSGWKWVWVGDGWDIGGSSLLILFFSGCVNDQDQLV